MHHHHPTNNSSAASTATVSAPAILTSASTTNIAQRRRKKRPNYGTRTVEVRRGYNGFGFTISGQQPCRLSCIVANSPADQAGLRAGDFLISVNNLNVSKMPHETVVQLIGNSFGSIRMQIAENYYSDSSDDEYAALMFQQQQQQQHQSSISALHTSMFSGISALGVGGLGGARARPRYLHHKTKMHRLRNSPQKKRSVQLQQNRQQMQCAEFLPSASSAAGAGSTISVKPMELQTLRPLIEESICSNSNKFNCSKSTAAPSVLSKPPLSSSDVANVSAMVRVPTAALEYRAIVGYLGTIEMPKQISHSSKLQTVRSCIRKLRQEKRQPTTVLITILPDCLRLQAANGNTLASYASERLNYVSSSSESENRFFGLVTSAVHTSQVDEEDDVHDDDDDEREHDDGNNQENLAGKSNIPMPASFSSTSNTGHISISNSCHVFVIDTKLCDHQVHIARANEFRIQCTKDPISNLCLEFPNNSEYVVNLVRSMYTMRILPPATRHAAAEDYANPAGRGGMGMGGAAAAAAAAHSPQPSNHSEISTTTSNSDSGIGFHNDCTNISDRILVVNFPGAHELRTRPASLRPTGIFNNFDAITDKRLTVRAMPDPKTSAGAATSMRPNLLANFNLIKSPASSLTTTRSCDDVLALVEHTPNDDDLNDSELVMHHASMDDISLHSSVATAMSEELHTFLHPSCIGMRSCGAGCSGAANRKLPFGTKTTAEAEAGTTTSLTYSLLQDCRSGVLERNSRHSMHLPLTSSSSIPSKLSPQVFASVGVRFKSSTKKSPPSSPAPSKSRHSLQFPPIDSSIQIASVTGSPLGANFDMDMDSWKSLQELNITTTSTSSSNAVPQCQATSSAHSLEVTNSEPALVRNRAIAAANVSPFRRAWGQSSFRTPRTDKHSHSSNSNHPSSPLVRRAASMTASDNDVYIKSMHGGGVGSGRGGGGGGGGASYIDELKQTHSQTQIAAVGTTTTAAAAAAKMLPQIKVDQTQMTTDGGPTGVTSWGTSFERLLQDAAGLHTFAEFLKKEFSAENIYFWTACERFRHMDCVAERVAQALAIFSKHLANGALEPVNVDSQARNLTEEKLQSAERDIFAHAQKQIFNLMKFDSYQRFIRSDLYKSCVEAEEKRQPLPYSGDDLDELLKTHLHQRQGGSMSNSSSNSNLSKLKKSASNAEDRCRKSLLPWHRKTSNTKSRERSETSENDSNKLTPFPSKLPLLSGSSLKIPSSHNSVSDLHSSRSSLSSFDALPSAFTTQACSSSNNQIAETSCSLCRVILSDGATTIVQTRHGETVGQLVERLLEKRGLCYQYYDVVANGSSKSIDLQSSAQALAGKEVLIEQRVAFKLDLPDPKVISVKSKPKKQLHEVIRPILHKYNYAMESVQVLMRDTHAQLDLSLPVTVADGQRLQIVLIKPPLPTTIGSGISADFHNGGGGGGVTTKFMKSAIPKSVTFPSNSSSGNHTAKQMGGCGGGGVNPSSRNGMMLPPNSNNNTSQNTLDEITNKVFNELMQGKVDAQASGEKYLPKTSDLCSLKSDDCASETSSIFDRMRRRDSNIPGFKLKYKKKSTSSQQSELEGTTNQNSNTNNNTNNNNIMNTTAITNAALDIKKPIIAKLKAGVKLQVTERVAENQDELLEGLKRAQLARLEDQRGTEINFELPDFLKNKENLSAAASKLRKVRANLSPINKTFTTTATTTTSVTTVIDEPTSPQGERPQPAPRLSITNKNKLVNVSPVKTDADTNGSMEQADTSNSSLEADYAAGCKGPPPLPPKPKVLPIKPSNWGVVSTATTTVTPATPSAITPSTNNNNKNYTTITTVPLAASSNNDSISHSNCNKILTNEQPSVINRIKTHLSPMEQQQTTTRCAYLEEPSSSFV